MAIISTLKADVKAVKANDPAAKSYFDVLINHAPLHAIMVHRFNHALYRIGVPILPRLFANIIRVWSGVEIHPGARIGRGFFIDHGWGTVIGETAEIGDNCILFQNITLGGTGKHSGKRHPSLGNNVYIGTQAILLGPITVGNNVKIGANTFIVMRDVPDNCTVVGNPGKIIKLNGKKADQELPKTDAPADDFRQI